MPKAFDIDAWLTGPYDFECPFCGAPPEKRCMTNVVADRPVVDWRVYYRVHAARRRLADA